MTQAHDCLALANEQQITVISYLKRILRLIAKSDCHIIFGDGSRLIYRHTDSWRTDRLEIDND